MRALAARPGAESTSWEAAPPPARLYATTPCSSSGSEAAVKTPGAPDEPPASIAEAVTGTLDDSLSAAGTPDSDGSGIETAEPPGRSSPGLPAGWEEPLLLTAVRLSGRRSVPGARPSQPPSSPR